VIGDVNVYYGVADVSVNKEIHDMNDESGSVVFHGCFPVSESVKCYA